MFEFFYPAPSRYEQFKRFIPSPTTLGIVTLVGGCVLYRAFYPSIEEYLSQLSSQKEIRFVKEGKEQVLVLDRYEKRILSELVDPKALKITFDDIGGLDDIKQSLNETVLLRLKNPALFADRDLLKPPKGILFYGPPGTGKTMLAKALASTAAISFIDLKLSSLMNKWFGESQQLVRATFSLANKIQPCILFIDELDVFFKTRDRTSNETTAAMKAEFMVHWDGLLTDQDNQVIIVGCTNRPGDIDPALKRRLGQSYFVGLPNADQRRHVLRLMLKGETLTDVDIETIVAATDNYSGSDLKELCKAAASFVVRDYCSETRDTGMSTGLRNLTTADFIEACSTCKPLGHRPIQGEYGY